MIWEGNAFRTRNKKRGDTKSKHFAKTKKISLTEVRLCRLLTLKRCSCHTRLGIVAHHLLLALVGCSRYKITLQNPTCLLFFSIIKIHLIIVILRYETKISFHSLLISNFHTSREVPPPKNSLAWPSFGFKVECGG